jgi:hypothetical protein
MHATMTALIPSLALLCTAPAIAGETHWKKVDLVFGRAATVSGAVHRHGRPRSDLGRQRKQADDSRREVCHAKFAHERQRLVAGHSKNVSRGEQRLKNCRRSARPNLTPTPQNTNQRPMRKMIDAAGCNTRSQKIEATGRTYIVKTTIAMYTSASCLSVSETIPRSAIARYGRCGRASIDNECPLRLPAHPEAAMPLSGQLRSFGRGWRKVRHASNSEPLGARAELETSKKRYRQRRKGRSQSD